MGYDLHEYANAYGTGTLTAISPPNACSFQSAQESFPWPRLQALSQWVSVWGVAPEIRIGDRKSSSAASEIIVQEQLNSSGAIVSYRVIARVASLGVTISQINGTPDLGIAQGYYSDLLVGPNGTIASMTRPAVFNNSSTPGSVGIYEIVDAAKAEAGVG